MDGTTSRDEPALDGQQGFHGQGGVPPNLRDGRSGHARLPDGFSQLTARQISILRVLAHGLTNTQIGNALHLSKYTVAQHVREMLKRTGAVNRTDLVNRAHAAGILQSAVDEAGEAYPDPDSGNDKKLS